MLRFVTAISNLIGLAGFSDGKSRDKAADGASFNIFRPGDGARHFRHGLRAESDRRTEGLKVTIN